MALKQALIWMIAAALAAPQGAWGQAPAAARGGLRVYVLQGEGAVNNTRTAVASSPLVEVRDSNDFPVAGAEVTFVAPASGASVAFEGGKSEYRNMTDARGQVSAGRMTPNGVEGAFSIQVSVRLGDRTAVAAIHQRNSRDEFEPGGAPAMKRRSFWGRHKWLLSSMALATGAGVGYYFAVRDTSSGASLKPGAVVIGGPR